MILPVRDFSRSITITARNCDVTRTRIRDFLRDFLLRSFVIARFDEPFDIFFPLVSKAKFWNYTEMLARAKNDEVRKRLERFSSYRKSRSFTRDKRNALQTNARFFPPGHRLIAWEKVENSSFWLSGRSGNDIAQSLPGNVLFLEFESRPVSRK